MWIWDQSEGSMRDSRGRKWYGYSGADLGKNNPAMEGAKALGPIPAGRWAMTGVRDSPNTGPFTITLVASAGTDTLGRSDFRIHGDSIRNPGTASHGCIILPRSVREKIWASGDRDLEVVH